MNSNYKYKISVIIVCHPQYDDLLKKAIQSLNAQLLNEFEVILVWNGYGKQALLKESNVLFDYLDIKHVYCNGNLAQACNLGINHSQGEYIIRLDADDFYHAELLLEAWSTIKNDNTIHAVWCDFMRFYTDVKTFETVVQPLLVLEHACGVLTKRDVFSTLGGYDETLSYQESFDFWLRFQKVGFKAKRIQRALYNYRQHRHSMSTNTANRNQARIDIITRIDNGTIADCFINGLDL